MTETVEKTVRTSSAMPRITHVLIADDDPNEHLLLTLAAESAGLPMELTFVDAGSDLISALADAQSLDELPDLIILDLRMPGMNGHRTLEHLQGHPIFCQIPVMMYTTSTRRQDEILAYRAGATWFETKATEFDGLIDLIERIADFAAYNWRNSYADDIPANWHAERLTALRGDLKADVEDELMSSTQ